MSQTIYLDHAAATPLDDDVLAAMRPYLTDQFYNPSALYLAAKRVAKDITAARERVAKQLGARPSEIVFTAGGTEANNLAIHGVMHQFPDGNVVATAIEHDSVLKPAAQYDYRIASVTERGAVDVEHLERLIDDNTVLVSIMYANNETGAVQPISQIAQVIESMRKQRLATGNTKPLYLHTDACQAANYLPLNKSRLGIDLMTINGGKVYGPKQSGCLFVATGTQLSPQVLGGGQERGMRSGTESAAQIVGFAAALAKAQTMRESESKRMIELRATFCGLLNRHVSDAVLTLTPKTGVLPNFVHVLVPNSDNERLIMELDEQGIMAAAGSACSASNDEPSHVLMAMGLSWADAQSSLRFTMGRSTTEADVRRVAEVLSKLAA